MESGLRIYNVEPLVEKAHFDNDLLGSVGIGEMLWRSNVIAVVAGGTKPKFADNTVLIYDDLSKKFVMEITFTNPIKAVRLRRDKYKFIFHFNANAIGLLMTRFLTDWSWLFRERFMSFRFHCRLEDCWLSRLGTIPKDWWKLLQWQALRDSCWCFQDTNVEVCSWWILVPQILEVPVRLPR